MSNKRHNPYQLQYQTTAAHRRKRAESRAKDDIAISTSSSTSSSGFVVTPKIKLPQRKEIQSQSSSVSQEADTASCFQVQIEQGED